MRTTWWQDCPRTLVCNLDVFELNFGSPILLLVLAMEISMFGFYTSLFITITTHYSPLILGYPWLSPWLAWKTIKRSPTNLSFGFLSKGVLRPGPNRWGSTARAATGEVTQALPMAGDGWDEERISFRKTWESTWFEPPTVGSNQQNCGYDEQGYLEIEPQKKEFAHKHGRLGTCSIELVGDFKHFEDILAALLDGRWYCGKPNNKPTICGWFIAPIKMLILGMVYLWVYYITITSQWNQLVCRGGLKPST